VDLTTLRVDVHAGVAWITIDHPPINLLDSALRADLDRLSRRLEDDRSIRVAVFQSALPDFFIAHADVGLFLDRQGPPTPKSVTLSWIHALGERLRRIPTVTIAKIEGRARGGGSEFALNLDMRFAAIGRAVFAQPEVGLGITPGGGATQRLTRLIGRARALEAILGGEDFDAETAERYGWVNRALPPDELHRFVDRLARRIASFSYTAIAYAKVAVQAAEADPTPGLLEEAHCFTQIVRTEEAQHALKAFLEAGGQTPDFELDLCNRLPLSDTSRKEKAE
jgi:enoyl-CoA hydratase/carnithine racemase